jgi:hypothetical protein
MPELINILIRTHRPNKLKECLSSVSLQNYDDKLIWLDENGGGMSDFSYNTLCNNLKAKVSDGWFFFLDDDDVLFSESSLSEISKHLTDPEVAVICQFCRNGFVKPANFMIRERQIIEGQIGMPCLFLHHSKKHIADIPATENGDYLWIKKVAELMEVKFVEVIVVNSPTRSYGQ